MKLRQAHRIKIYLAIVSLVPAGIYGSLQAQLLPNSVAESLYPPELVRMAQPALQLTDEQRVSLSEAVEKAQSHVADFQERLKAETEILAALVKEEKLDTEAVMAQADKVMRLERDIKWAQLGLLVQIKNTLTPEQQAKVRELKSRTTGMQAKVGQAQALAQKWKQEGRDLSAFEQARDQFEARMKEGNFKAAEALLDQALKLLNTPKK